MSLIQWVELPDLGDDKGTLIVAETQKNIPFDIKRIYYILDVNPSVSRGFHAHKKLFQIAFCIKGSFKMLMDDGSNKQEVYIGKSNKGLMIPPMIWHEMHDFSEDCVLLVLASEHYDENDYIRDYEKFKSYDSSKLALTTYDKDFLEKSWQWLHDAELKHLTMTPDFSKEQQADFFASLPLRKDYSIYGVAYLDEPIGACGLKNIINEEAELWLYIGNKQYWGRGLGTMTMSLLESEAIAKGLKKLYLNVIKDNKVAISLYQKMNYDIVSKNDDYIVMEKRF